MSKVIDMTSRLKTVAPLNEAKTATAEVLNYTEQKSRLLFHERRQAKRSILTEFISAMVVIPEKGLLKVDLYDISEEGISFDIDENQGQFTVDEIVSLRVYLNQKTYFPLSLQVKHVTHEKTEGVARHGTVFLRSAATAGTDDAITSNASLQYFVRFIESAGAGLKQDNGDLMAPKIS